MKWGVLASMLLIPLPAAAQDPSPLHDVGPGSLTHGPVSSAVFEKRIQADAERYIMKYPGASADRFAEFDVTLPLTPSEYEAMGRYAIVLVASFSQKAEELPLRVLRAGELELHCVGQIHRDVPQGTPAANFFGANRVDAFYIVPVASLKRGAILNADFARNRSGFTIGELSAVDAPDFITNGKDDAPTHPPAASALKAMIDREYPGVGIETQP